MERRRRIEGLKGSWEWLEFAAQLPANPQMITGQAGNKLIYSGRCILTGACVNNTATTAGTVQLLDGQDATGGLVAGGNVAASGITNVPVNGQGILCEVGVFLVVATATLTGSILIIPLWHDEYTAPGD